MKNASKYSVVGHHTASLHINDMQGAFSESTQRGLLKTALSAHASTRS
jgi:hypothetical protein